MKFRRLKKKIMYKHLMGDFVNLKWRPFLLKTELQQLLCTRKEMFAVPGRLKSECQAG